MYLYVPDKVVLLLYDCCVETVAVDARFWRRRDNLDNRSPYQQSYNKEKKEILALEL